MKYTKHLAAAGAILAVTVGIVALAAPPDRKTAEAICRQGWRGTAVGEYGGVPFSVSCDNGRGRTQIVGAAGTVYSVRVGVESAGAAFDCFYSGDAQVVRESCADVTIFIR